MKACLFVMLCSFSTIALAQSASATANVSANMTTMLTVTRNSDLTFGTVTQGATSSVASNSSNAAEFMVYGAASTSTSVSITYPAGSQERFEHYDVQRQRLSANQYNQFVYVRHISLYGLFERYGKHLFYRISLYFCRRIRNNCFESGVRFLFRDDHGYSFSIDSKRHFSHG